MGFCCAPTTPKSDITVLGSADHSMVMDETTPMRRVDRGGAASPSSSSDHDYFDRPRGSVDRDRARLESNGRAGTPPLSLGRRGGRDRVDSNASRRGVPVNGNGTNGNGMARITVTAPSDGAEALRRRLQEAVSAASERGAGQVTLDVGLVQSLLSVFDQQMSEYASLKQNLDGMKVSPRYLAQLPRR